jgi:hypothetical protein
MNRLTEHVEYGVILDRTRDGLGHQLVHVYRERNHAEVRADTINAENYYPARVQVRTVRYSEWKDVTS